MAQWFRERYGLDKPGKPNSADGGDPRLLMIAVVRDINEMSIKDQLDSLERIEGSRRFLKIIKPTIKEGANYEDHVIESWMKLVQAVADYSGIIYVAHPHVVSTNESFLTSVLRTGVGMGVAIMILQ